VKSDAAQWSLSSVRFRDAANGWIVGFGGTILRSRDGGATWAALPSPAKTWLSAIAFDDKNRGWIAAEWKPSENNRRAKYYSLTALGRGKLNRESADWVRLSGAISRVMRLKEA